ncbi:MAG: cytochrome b5 domain-containing protein [Chloroflexi bacterium]|nr:cytochrome b5 domain-containing protein [Chloroflexota bacterium]
MLYRLIGEDRLMLEIFTTYAGTHFDHGKPQFDMSDVAQHNSGEQGYWIVISGRVYEMREFNHIHPGGAKIIQSYSGMDGTLAYQKVEHHINPEVDSMLGMFELGVVRTPDFGQEWGVAVSDKGLRFVTLRDTYLAWTDLLQMLVEIENAVQNDFRVRYEPLTDIETHDRSY